MLEFRKMLRTQKMNDPLWKYFMVCMDLRGFIYFSCKYCLCATQYSLLFEGILKAAGIAWKLFIWILYNRSAWRSAKLPVILPAKFQPWEIFKVLLTLRANCSAFYSVNSKSDTRLKTATPTSTKKSHSAWKKLKDTLCKIPYFT